jgi:putative ABC transport system substrate-binding protein
VIGFLRSGSPIRVTRPRGDGFEQGLLETGYVRSRNVAFEYRWAHNDYERLPALAAELVDRKVAVIVTNGPGAVAAKAVTSTTPIVFGLAIDPVEVGLVASLSRPGGNLTGVTSLGAELGPKRLELLHEMIPTAVNIGVLIEPSNPLPEALSIGLQTSADKLGLRLHFLHATLLQLLLGGLVITPAALFGNRIQHLTRLIVRHAVPAIAPWRDFAAAGGLMAYGGTSAARLLGSYAGRILKGEKPADLPVQQSMKLDLVINLNAAKALDLTVPRIVRALADEVIE